MSAVPAGPDPVAPITVRRAPLTVGPVDDPLEREADAIADRVMRMPLARSIDPPRAADTIRRCPGGCPGEEAIRRQPTDEDDDLLTRAATGPAPTPDVDGATAATITTKRGRGTSLPRTARDFFEPRLGRDLGQVNIHVDRVANDLASLLNARAFTVGHDIFFGSGQWNPGTPTGDRLLAHELTHTIQ